VKNKVKQSGIVLEALPSANFKVKLDDGREVLCHLAGKLRIYRIKVLPGDRVTVEMSSYDERRGRIVFRGR
jgi:translation initiation factor IF-1